MISNENQEDSPINKASEIKDSVKEYLDMRINALKLQLIEYLSLITAKILFYILFFVLLSIALFFLGSTFSLWIGELLNSQAAGALITASIFLICCLIVFMMRRKIFVDSMVGMFSKMFFEQRDNNQFNNQI